MTDIYVNYFMLTDPLAATDIFTIFNFLAIYCGFDAPKILNVVFARQLAKTTFRVNILYLLLTLAGFPV